MAISCPSLLARTAVLSHLKIEDMAERSDTTERLDSWKDIATYLGRNVRTAMRWEHGKGLPVHRLPGGQRQAVFAWRHELDAWIKNGDSPVEEVTNVNVNHGSGDTSVATTVDDLVPIPSPTSSSGPIPLRETFHPKRTAWIAGIATLLMVGYIAYKFEFRSNFKFTNVVQITGDGAVKNGLVTDGRTLYFGEYQEGRTVLSEVAVGGGPVKRISTPFVRVIPIDISPDRSSLLTLVSEGRPEEEGTLWIIPVTGGQRRPVGRVRCHAAAWSPDGRTIAVASKTGIYLTADEGASLQLVQSFDAVPMALRWSFDGMTLRIELQDEKSMALSFWDLRLAKLDGSQVSALVPLGSVHTDAFDVSMTLDGEGRSFAAGGNPWKENIFVLAKDRELWNSQFLLKSLESPINTLSALTLDPETKRIFAIGCSAALEGDTNEADLIRFDPTAHQFRPFLPGLFAEYVDFSRDGKWIAYVKRPDLTVWISRPDGSDARKLAFSGTDFELPRWSPDGKKVAVMAKLSTRPWRILMIDVLAGRPREASAGNSSQGAPTWSPDGKKLIYGDVECQETGSCAIHEIDVSTGREFTIPGSEGLGTARWSPDGRYIAALNPIRHEVLMFELATQRWRKLMDGVNGNDLSWSVDSRYLFASKLGGGEPEILRISHKDGKIERAVDLSDFAKLRGRIDTWFAVAPQGYIIFSRELGSNEIYALGYQDR
jgi:Tol biopolymer transport system component